MSSWVSRDLDAFMATLTEVTEGQEGEVGADLKLSESLRLGLKVMRVAPLAITEAFLELLKEAITCHAIITPQRHNGDESRSKLASLVSDAFAELKSQLIAAPQHRASMFGQWALRLLAHSSLASASSSTIISALVSLASECFAMQSNSLTTLLLELRASRGSTFDWIINSVASRVPYETISRVLDVGLNDFLVFAQTNFDDRQRRNLELKVLEKRLECIVAILIGDLTLTHKEAILDALRRILKSANAKDDPKTRYVLPYLTKLASISMKFSDRNIEPDTLLNALTSDLHLLDASEVRHLFQHAIFDDLVFSNSNSDSEEEESMSPLLASAVGMIMRLEKPYEVLKLLLTVGNDEEGEIWKHARAIVDALVLKLTTDVHESYQKGRFIYHLQSQLLSVTKEFLISDSAFHRKNAVALLSLVVLEQEKNNSNGIFCQVLLSALVSRELKCEHLGSVVHFIKRVQLWRDVSLDVVIERGISSRSDCLTFLSNWLSLAKFRSDSSTAPLFKTLVSHHYVDLANLLLGVGNEEREELILALLIVSDIGNGTEMDVCTGYKMCYSLINVIFRCIGRDRNALILKRCVLLLTRLSSPSLLPVMQRLLLQGALDSEYALLFGGKNEQASINKKTKRKNEDANTKCLLEENYKFISMPTKPLLGATTSFHAGIIGQRGGLNNKSVGAIDAKSAELNRFVFVTVLFRLCSGSPTLSSSTKNGNKLMGRERAKEACKLLALTLVEVVTPDVMYNGLPWPEEEFTKVTMERDLSIYRYFDSHPILWPIMQGLAEARPALCYTSVLLRAIMAVQMNFWSSCIAHKVTEYPRQLETTCKVLELMAIGQFLPEPLDKLSLVVRVLSAFHLHCILLDVWNFMRDHVPSPVAYASNAQGALHRHFDEYASYRQYCERLRLIMLHHVKDLPKMVKGFFIDYARTNGMEADETT